MTLSTNPLRAYMCYLLYKQTNKQTNKKINTTDNSTDTATATTTRINATAMYPHCCSG